MAHKQSYVTVVLNKRRYSSEIAMFDMTRVFFATRSSHDTSHITRSCCQRNVV